METMQLSQDVYTRKVLFAIMAITLVLMEIA